MIRQLFPKLWPKLKKLISPKNIGSYFMMGAFVLLIATYGVWQLQQLFSPDSGTSGDTATVKIQLKASDRTAAGTPLFRELQPPSLDVPYYPYNATTEPTALPNNSLFRIQGEVYYKDK